MRVLAALSGRRAAAALCLAAAALKADPALAHAAEGAAGRGAHWTDALLGVALAAAGALYAAGLGRLWGEGPRGVARWRAAAFAAGLALVAGLTLSPLEPMAARFLSAHMVQHVGLMLLAAPLIVLGQPGPVLLWALPRGARRTVGRFFQGTAGRVARAAISPLGAWTVYLLALWVWHAPPLYQAALRDPLVHALEHATFLGAALLFWSAVLNPARGEARAGAFLAVFATAIHSSALAALMTTSQVLWYPAYEGDVAGLSPLRDQHLGGLIMWVPGGAVLVGAAVAILARLLQDTALRNGERAPR